MDIEQAIQEITNFRDRGQNWCWLAGIVQDVTQRQLWRSLFNSNAEWVKEAAKRSGYHPAVIRRMVRAKQFLDRMISEEGIPLCKEDNMPLASIEILERMYQLAPDRVKELLPSAVRGQITLREVQGEYDEIVNKRPDKAEQRGLERRHAKAFEQRAIKAIYDTIQYFSGDASILKVRPTITPFPLGVNLVAVTCRDWEREYDGFAIRLGGDGSRNNRGSVLQNIAFSSQFFRRYWIVLPEHVAMDFEEYLYDSLRTLQLYNVSIAVLRNQPQGSSPEDLWEMRSVYRPEATSTQDPVFFAPNDVYTPKWKELPLHGIR
jgi:hypothetical protein